MVTARRNELIRTLTNKAKYSRHIGKGEIPKEKSLDGLVYVYSVQSEKSTAQGFTNAFITGSKARARPYRSME